MTDFFTSESSADQVINAELLVTDFLVEHNLPMAVADDALAAYFLQKTVESMKTKPSVSVDALISLLNITCKGQVL